MPPDQPAHARKITAARPHIRLRSPVSSEFCSTDGQRLRSGRQHDAPDRSIRAAPDRRHIRIAASEPRPAWNGAETKAKIRHASRRMEPAHTTTNREEGMNAKPTRRRFFAGCQCCEPSRWPSSPARRKFLAGGAAALGLGAVSGVGGAAPAVAQTPAAKPPAAKTRIDVHHHFIPQFHVDAMMAPGRRAGAPPPKWSPATSLEDMDKSGIATSILSVVQPGIWYGRSPAA